MRRLTFVDEDGNVLFGVNGADEDEGYTIFQLAEEGMTDELEEIAKRLANTEQRLEYYEDLEEQGRLIELPCAVGDTVYVKMLGGGLAKAKVRDYVHFLTDGFCLTLTSDEFPKQHIPISEIGKTVFLTQEEAEARLAEMEGE